jgi:exopolysaccharide biosynthesis polyprenyl glycosylphosphotransferase
VVKPAERVRVAHEATAPRARVPDIRSSRPAVLAGLARRSASVAALIVVDLAGVTLGVYAALVVRELYYGHVPPLWGVLWGYMASWLPFLGLVSVLVFWQAGLYAPRERRAGIGRVIGSVALVTAITVAFGLGTGALDFTTYGFFPTAALLTAVIVGLLRASYDLVSGEAMRLAGVRRRTLLVGKPESVVHLQSALGSVRSGIDYEFVGAVADADWVPGLPLLAHLDELPAVLAERRVDEVIVADADFHEDDLLEIVDVAHRRAVKIRVAPKTTELLTARAEYVPGEAVPLFELRPPVLAGTDWLLKRTFDIVVSAAAVVAGLPLWLAIAAAIKLTSSGPILYRDRRIGLNHRQFTMFKFRTMRVGADELQAQLEDENEADGALFKIRADPRVTPVGAALRRLSIDELPQLLNVLGGEMSLVGPRPLRLRDYARLEDWHRKRNLVLPGMTGLWQISGRSLLSFDDLVRLDFTYLETWSLWMDITILLKTIPAVLGRRGAY